MLVECIARVFQRRTKPIYTQIAIICRFWRKWNIISLPFEIFQRPNDLFTVRYMQNVVHAYPSDETSPDTRKSQSFADLDEKKRYFSPVWDISTFKPSFHCIMRALCSARDFESKNKPRYTQIAFTLRFWRKLSVVSLPFEIFRRLNALFTALCLWNVLHAFSSVEVCPDTRKSQSFADFDEN